MPRSASGSALALGVVFGVATTLQAQRLPDYPHESNLLVDTPGTTSSIAGGLFNPAAWAAQTTGGLFFSWEDAATSLDRNTWTAIVSARRFSFGVRQFGFEPVAKDRFRVRDYTIGVGGGRRAHAWGLSYSWAAGDIDRMPRHERLALGDVYRWRWASLGTVTTWDLERRDNLGEMDLGLRPFGPRLTLFADAVLEHGDSFEDIRTGYGLEVHPTPGLAIAAKMRSTGEVSLRLGLAFDRNSWIGMHAQLSDGGDRLSSTYTVEAGAPHAFLSGLTRQRRYPELDLRGPLVYQRYKLFDRRATLLALLRRLDAIGDDPAAGGVLLNLSDAGIGAEMAWELRQQLAGLRARGKKVIVYVDTPSLFQLMLASVADQVWLDPEGTVDIRGLAAGRTYMRHALEKAGIGVDEWRFFTYKSAFESYSRDSASEPDREQRQALIDDFYQVVAASIASARGMPQSQFDALTNSKGILMAEEARAAGLVDSLGGFEAARKAAARAARRVTPDASAEVLGDLQGDPMWRDQEWGEFPQIAVLYAIGPCAMDEGIRGRELSKAIHAAAADRHVKAIVLRADSPGGAILPSDLVAREMQAAKRKKPVLVSQGRVAASGGYWISMNADTIVASPLTITGSIGVIGGWLWNKTFGDKIGFDYDGVKRGEHADLELGITLPLVGEMIPDRALTAEERDRIEQSIRIEYRDFVAKVAAARRLPESTVDGIGQGRVWSGTRGHENGLVDEIGGLWTTLRLAKQAAKIPAGRPVQFMTGPSPGLVDLSGWRPRLIGALAGDTAGAPHAIRSEESDAVRGGSTPTLGGVPLSVAECDFLRQILHANGQPLVLVDPIEVQDGAHDR